jgi:hypothetical protein
MSTQREPSPCDALADVPDFREASGRRYELLPVLLLCCVAIMCGARSQSAIAEWGSNYRERWLQRLGMKRRRGPSQPTLHRIFKGLTTKGWKQLCAVGLNKLRALTRPRPPRSLQQSPCSCVHRRKHRGHGGYVVDQTPLCPLSAL